MNGNGHTHPGRSVDFLSRLHDGELDAGERARFEAHRAHCAECRRAAIEFEDAIALFRSTRSMPPRSDLAARILRKVQSRNRPRAPFPMRFRIDLGWAALLLTALFVLLITTPVVLRQHDGVRSPASPLARPAPQSVERAPAVSPPATVRGEKRESGDLRRAAPPRLSEKARPAAPGEGAARDSESESAATFDRSEPVPKRREAPAAAATAPESASAGGEGEPSARIAAAAPSLLLSVREVDGFGAPPDLRSETRISLPVTERGREYVLLVDAQGTVRGVAPDNETSRKLSRLRFEPGHRPRRLLVRLE